MKAGKISEAVLKRSVLKAVNGQLKQKNASKAGVGVDAGLFAVPEHNGTMAAASAAVAGNAIGMAELAVYRACNSLVAAGAVPVAVTVQLVLPESMEETGLKQTMQELLAACGNAGVLLNEGHTQISPLVAERVVSVSAIGMAAGMATLNETVAGSELVMTKAAGLAGTVLLAENYREALHERYTYAFIDKARARREELTVLPEARLLMKAGIVHMHDIAEGGVFGAVWELAERLQAGAEIDLKKIPILQETVEISEYFDVNPYQLRGDGALLFLTHDSALIIEKLAEIGISAAVIGRMTEGNDRILVNEDEQRHLEPNRVEEYERAVQRMREQKGE
ncbi:MAG: hypothetical protein E7260_03885 [Lachnospiraceae bacterium]|nr:hypothetical protein [Lachnospiraceae bacterium]